MKTLDWPHLPFWRWTLLAGALLWTSGCSETPADANPAPDADVALEDVFEPIDAAGEDVGSAPEAEERPEPGPGSWRLPEGYYVPAKMEMTLVHPRPEAAEWAYSKNAHPGVRWEIPIVVQGGAWPFQYAIVDDGGAEGLQIGGELMREDVEGFIVHRVSPEYGVLWWDDPQEGDYDITLRVSDQDGSTLDIEVSLRVGEDGWLFVDGSSGSPEGDGSLEAPFASVDQIHALGEAAAGHRVYVGGVVPMDGNRENGNLRIAEDTPTPAVWVGWPGREGVLEAYEGKIVLDRPDFYMANLEHRHHEDYFPMEDSYLHMITVWYDTDRYTVHDVEFTRFQGVGSNVNLGNSSIMMLTKNDHGRKHVAVVNNTLSGPNGILTSSYQLRHAVFEKNRAVDAVFTVADGSVWSIIYIKSGNNEFVTLRANAFVENNEWPNRKSALGVLRARNIELAYNLIDTPYDSGRTGALTLWTNSALSDYGWTTETPVWIYRNSLRQRISYEGDPVVNLPDGTVITEHNILDQGSWPTSSKIVDIENLDEAAYLDESMRLTGEHRDARLGRWGAEIAVPVD